MRLQYRLASGLGLASLLLLAACNREPAPANDQAGAANEAAPAAEGDVGAAQRLVSERLGNPEGLTFANPLRTASEGVTIVCGDYIQGSARQRYIVVDGHEVFLEPQMGAGEMDSAYAEFCREGSGNRPSPVAPQGNGQ